MFHGVDPWAEPGPPRARAVARIATVPAVASFDYDVLIIGSGFGGSVAALRAAEKGYRVGVMESGRRWRDEDIPKTQWDLPHFLWFPAAELYGIQRIEYLDDVLILSGAGVGGGSHVYDNTLYGKKLENRDIVTNGVRAPKAADKLIALLNRYSAKERTD